MKQLTPGAPALRTTVLQAGMANTLHDKTPTTPAWRPHLAAHRPNYDQISTLLALTLTITLAIYTLLNVLGGEAEDVSTLAELFTSVAALVAATQIRL
ncbi:hypothetical protein [Streptomyces sp. NPDC060001]|uniref:hypothetical protein n=1 Tax=Streptomyces sp. NPDC060001 TaxID=3347032 RepID=UPI0036A84E1D